MIDMLAERCIRQINKVREVAAGAEVAYVARSRLSRLILSLVQLVSKECGLEIPDRLFPVHPREGSSDFSVELACLCNRLLEASRTLCQPSEPLDERWRSGWSALLDDLDELEMKLSSGV